ncbi:hypothetical protein BTVI_59464 [Pitangus sulphuratus]|nr:hypothetical protein BTVI_59464 [Pitangus sulphuratus]
MLAGSRRDILLLAKATLIRMIIFKNRKPSFKTHYPEYFKVLLGKQASQINIPLNIPDGLSPGYQIGQGYELGRRDAIHMDLDRLEEWARGNLMSFNKAKCKVLYLSQGNLKHGYMLHDEWTESSPAEKDLGALVNKDHNTSHQ